MFELGTLSENEHNRITQYAVDAQINNIWLVGEHFSNTSIESNSISRFKTREDLCNWLNNNNKFEKTVFLLKGSRGMALEKVLPFLGVSL
jgi:UDP-N-acetylmuramoyl-tripeptide--D-alanyl-D-alanine ligase